MEPGITLLLIFLIIAIGVLVWKIYMIYNTQEDSISGSPVIEQTGGGIRMKAREMAKLEGFAPNKIRSNCGAKMYGNWTFDDSSLLATYDDTCPIRAGAESFTLRDGRKLGYKFYANPCLSEAPYGTVTAGFRYMEQLGRLNNELYRNCDSNGCPGRNNQPACQSYLPKVEKICDLSPAYTQARNNITEEMYHNPTEYCKKNPDHPRCALNSGPFSPYTAVTLGPMDQTHPIGRPLTDYKNGYCLETDPLCQVNDTRGITVIQPNKLVPC